MVRNVIVIMILCCGLLACKHSPRKHYFVLSSVTEKQIPANNVTQGARTENTTLIGIGPVDVADYLDHSHIVYTEKDNALTVIDNDYWAEPLKKGVARVISLNLLQLNPTRSFVNFPWRSDSKPHYSLRVNLHSLAKKNNQVSISATWELIDNNDKRNIKRRTFTQSTPVAAGSEAMVQGVSKLLGELAEEMNSSLITTQ